MLTVFVLKSEFKQKFSPLVKNLYNELDFMKEYLSHFSAAILWNIPYIDNIIGFKIADIDTANITVSEHDARFRKNGKLVHSCELALPTGAITTRNGKAVASPELLFLELASKLSIHRLIFLGLELCAHPPGEPAKSITTEQKLKKFLAKTHGHRGCHNAARAVKYVKDGSASIMESLAYMILTLPHALGGYGLNGAIFNHEILLKSNAERLKQNRFYTDLYYKEARLAVEYESFTYHNSPSEQGRDMLRSASLERQGIVVMRLSTIQLYDKDASREFAKNLAVRLGKRIHIRTEKFIEMHDLLRALLPNGN